MEARGACLLSVLLAVLAAGCVQPGTVTCGDFVCAAGSRCMAADDGPQRCVTPAQIAACDGHDPFADCGTGGRCYQLVDAVACLDPGCGNGFVDPEEQCDDFNNTSLDGCSADCRSTESCGNGEIDVLLGEQCDDGNPASHDGCSSSCRSEAAGWVPVSTEVLPPFNDYGLAYDDRRARLMVIGGTYISGNLSGSPIENPGVGEWDGEAWHVYTAPISPLPRDGAAIAYDTRRGVTVLFGGLGDLADTWEWNGTAWRQRDEIGPPGRMSASMAYDAKRGVIVMYGGIRSSGADSAIWEWNGVAWTSIEGGMVNTSRLTPQIAFDARRGVMVMIAGMGASGTEIYERTDGPWTRVATVPDLLTTIAFDPVHEAVLGVREDGGTFTWDGAAWTMHAGSLGGSVASLATDAVHRKVLAFSPDPGSSFRNGPYEWDGTKWQTSPVVGYDAPLIGEGAAVAYLPDQKLVVVAGGSSAPALTWIYDGSLWQTATGAAISGRTDTAAAYRSASHEVILFGGVSGGAVTNDTYAWAGAGWTKLPGAAPPARRGHAMAYDPMRDRIVLFGGSIDASDRTIAVQPCSCPDAATWEFDGTAWAMVPVVEGPKPRRDAAMAYDPVRHHIVMFGGYRDSDSTAANDTWTYDGTWHEQHPLASPPPRLAATFAWDPARQRLVLFGGFRIHAAGSGLLPTNRIEALDDIWEWDGQRWRRVVPTSVPIARGGHIAFTAPDGAGVLSFGGKTIDENGFIDPIDGQHAIRWVSDSAEETCASRLDADGDGLAGCTDPDCRAVCTTCGDQSCDMLETEQICAADCGAPPVTCSDGVCDMGESCPADCP